MSKAASGASPPTKGVAGLASRSKTGQRSRPATVPSPVKASPSKDTKAPLAPTFTRAAFTVSWIWAYGSLLKTANGRLVTRAGYAATYDGRDPELSPAWMAPDARTGRPRWSRFWTSYLDSLDLLRSPPTADVAWNHVVPFGLTYEAAISLEEPALDNSVTGTADVLVYPSAIAVVIGIDASGEWPIDALAPALSGMRDSRSWSMSAPGIELHEATLDRIAGKLRKKAVRLLADESLETPPQTVLTVAAPLTARANEEDQVREASLALDLDTAGNEDARTCVAALAVLEAGGSFNEQDLLEKNRSGKRSGRIYVSRRGHAIWHPNYIIEHDSGVRPQCLLRNHMELVTQIAVLGEIVSWAARRIEKRASVATSVQPLVARAASRLDQLYTGQATYRAEVAQRRIKPLLPKIKKIECELP